MTDLHKFALVTMALGFGLLLFAVLMAHFASLPNGKIRASAKRLGLRDKGAVEPTEDSNGNKLYDTHTLCHTYIRIGIDKNGTRTCYCWRCEEIFDDNFKSRLVNKAENTTTKTAPRREDLTGVVVDLDSRRPKK